MAKIKLDRCEIHVDGVPVIVYYYIDDESRKFNIQIYYVKISAFEGPEKEIDITEILTSDAYSEISDKLYEMFEPGTYVGRWDED
jgi:hypothetical protein